MFCHWVPTSALARWGGNAAAKPGWSQGSEATDLLILAFLQLFFALLAQKSRVKSQNRLTIFQSTSSTWHVSYTQTDILDI